MLSNHCFNLCKQLLAISSLEMLDVYICKCLSQGILGLINLHNLCATFRNSDTLELLFSYKSCLPTRVLFTEVCF